MIDVDELERLALAATPGPWEWNDMDQMVAPERMVDYGSGPEPESVRIIETDSGVYPPEPNDRAYIAAFHPGVALELIERLRKEIEINRAAEQAIRAAEAVVDSNPGEFPFLRAAVDECRDLMEPAHRALPGHHWTEPGKL